jgi:hypothetical protein
MPKLHPAVINHIQVMQDDLSDMMENPSEYDPMEVVKLSMLLLDLYEDILEQFGIMEFERQVH